jgi:hypothetical protein
MISLSVSAIVCFVYATTWLVLPLRVQMLIGKLCIANIYNTTYEMPMARVCFNRPLWVILNDDGN